MKVIEFNNKKIYSEASGVCALVDKNIRMELNEFGLYEATTSLNDDEEVSSLVEFVSPNLNSKTNEMEIARQIYGDARDIHYDEKIGFYKSLYAGYVEEGKYRENGSSGGMATWLFKTLLEQDLIDGVIHVKENSERNSSILFKYGVSKTIDEVKEGAKSKYYPVEFSEVLKIVKEVPGRYAIIGIPSFIMAIRLLAEKQPVFQERIKYTIGLICGHQKSSKFAESMAWQMGIKPENLKGIDFRKKVDDFASEYAIELTGVVDGKEVNIIADKSNLMGQDWGQGYFKSIASDFTDDVMNETADVVLGDAWLPKYNINSKGNNIIIVRNTEIDNLLVEGIKTGKLKLDEVDTDTIIKSQEAHYRHTHDELAYRLNKKVKREEWIPKKRVDPSKEIPYLRRRIQDMREEISAQSHIIYKKAVEIDDINYFYNNMNKYSRKYKRLYMMILLRRKGLLGIFKAIIKRLRIAK